MQELKSIFLMTHHASKIVAKGMDVFAARIRGKKRIYKKLLDLAHKDKADAPIYHITDPALFETTIQNFGAILESLKAKQNLQTIYEIGIHKETGTLLVCNKGATLFCLSPRSETPYLVRHVGFSAYVPGLGVEFINVGLVGNVYQGPVVLRCESACAPSFLFGSQRCNCAHQWASVLELAASFNKANAPGTTDGSQFEHWVREQVIRDGNKHIFKSGGPGFILMHVDTQNGMGSGFSNGEFAFDLFSRASLRHRGEYSSEQIHKTTMSGGFEAIGLRPDPRQENGNAGYKISFVILDYLGVSKNIIYLTNNPLKLQHLRNNGYKIERVSLMGEINIAGSQEAKERYAEFGHLDISGSSVTFKEDFAKVRQVIAGLIRGNSQIYDKK